MPQVYASTSSREVPAYTARGGTRPSSLHPGRPTGQAWGVSAARDVSRGDNQNVAMSAFVDQGVHVCNTIQFPVEDRTKLTFIVYSHAIYMQNILFQENVIPCHTLLFMLAEHFLLHRSKLLDATPHGLVDT